MYGRTHYTQETKYSLLKRLVKPNKCLHLGLVFLSHYIILKHFSCFYKGCILELWTNVTILVLSILLGTLRSRPPPCKTHCRVLVWVEHVTARTRVLKPYLPYAYIKLFSIFGRVHRFGALGTTE